MVYSHLKSIVKINSSSDTDMSPDMNESRRLYGILEILSFILHIIIQARIFRYKAKVFVPPIQTAKTSIASNLRNHSLSRCQFHQRVTGSFSSWKFKILLLWRWDFGKNAALNTFSKLVLVSQQTLPAFLASASSPSSLSRPTWFHTPKWTSIPTISSSRCQFHQHLKATFRTNDKQASSRNLLSWFKHFWGREIGRKAARKMLVKLTKDISIARAQLHRPCANICILRQPSCNEKIAFSTCQRIFHQWMQLIQKTPFHLVVTLYESSLLKSMTTSFLIRTIKLHLLCIWFLGKILSWNWGRLVATSDTTSSGKYTIIHDIHKGKNGDCLIQWFPKSAPRTTSGPRD